MIRQVTEGEVYWELDRKLVHELCKWEADEIVLYLRTLHAISLKENLKYTFAVEEGRYKNEKKIKKSAKNVLR